MKFLLTLLVASPLLCFGQKSISNLPHIPSGMKLVWNDEFNDLKLDTAKWSTNYYSTFDFAAKTNFEDFRNDNLTQPAVRFTDSTIICKRKRIVSDNR